MLSEPDRVRLQHMLDVARIAVRSVAGRRREDLDDQEDLLVHGLVRLVGAIGEAGNRVSDARSKRSRRHSLA